MENTVRTYRGWRDARGALHVLVSEHVAEDPVVHVRRLSAPCGIAFAIDTGPGGEAVARAICLDLFGARRLVEDPGVYLEFLFSTVRHLDPGGWVLSEEAIRAAIAPA